MKPTMWIDSDDLTRLTKEEKVRSLAMLATPVVKKITGKRITYTEWNYVLETLPDVFENLFESLRFIKDWETVYTIEEQDLTVGMLFNYEDLKTRSLAKVFTLLHKEIK